MAPRKCAHPKCNRARRKGSRTCSNRHTRSLAAIEYRRRKKYGEQVYKCDKCGGSGWLKTNPRCPI